MLLTINRYSFTTYLCFRIQPLQAAKSRSQRTYVFFPHDFIYLIPGTFSFTVPFKK